MTEWLDEELPIWMVGGATVAAVVTYMPTLIAVPLSALVIVSGLGIIAFQRALRQSLE